MTSKPTAGEWLLGVLTEKNTLLEAFMHHYLWFLILSLGVGCTSSAVPGSGDSLRDTSQDSEDSGEVEDDWDPWASGDLSLSFLPEGQANHIMNGWLAIDEERVDG